MRVKKQAFDCVVFVAFVLRTYFGYRFQHVGDEQAVTSLAIITQSTQMKHE